MPPSHRCEEAAVPARAVLDRDDQDRQPQSASTSSEALANEAAPTQHSAGLMAGVIGSTQLTTPEDEVVSAHPCCPPQLACVRSAVEASRSGG